MPTPLEKTEHYNYLNYQSCNDEKRWEIIDGFAYDMSPAPSRSHQKITGELFVQIKNHLKNNVCQVYISPFDVILYDKNQTDMDIVNVVQPDISIICDKTKLTDKGCKGSPDWIIEVISPSTAKKDTHEKLFLYEKYGVKEYWVVYPNDKIVSVYKLNIEKKYGTSETYTLGDKVKSEILSGLEIDLNLVFESD